MRSRGCLTGNIRNSTASASEKIDMFARAPSASVSTATNANIGLRRNPRPAYLKSRPRSSSHRSARLSLVLIAIFGNNEPDAFAAGLPDDQLEDPLVLAER